MTTPGQTPTEIAEGYFKTAYDRALAAANHTRNVQDPTGIAIYDIAASLTAVSKGLSQMAIGLRATYIALERMERKLERGQLPLSSLTFSAIVPAPVED